MLMLRMLKLGGRCAVIVPDGVLFGSSNAHVAARRLLVEENQLEAVVKLPAGVFKPYAGVSTAILIFTKGGRTTDVWFYDVLPDGKQQQNAGPMTSSARSSSEPSEGSADYGHYIKAATRSRGPHVRPERLDATLSDLIPLLDRE